MSEVNNRLDSPKETISLRSSESYRLNDQIGFLLGRAFAQAHSNLRKRLEDLEITPPQHAVIMKLYEQGEVSQNSLGRMIGMKPATIHGIVRRMERRGFMITKRSPQDQRLMFLTLTDDGLILADELAKRSTEATAETLLPLNPEEQTTLKTLLNKLL